MSLLSVVNNPLMPRSCALQEVSYDKHRVHHSKHFALQIDFIRHKEGNIKSIAILARCFLEDLSHNYHSTFFFNPIVANIRYNGYHISSTPISLKEHLYKIRAVTAGGGAQFKFLGFVPKSKYSLTCKSTTNT